MATIWYAQQSSVNLQGTANMWNDLATGLGNWLDPLNDGSIAALAADDTLRANGKTAIAINANVTCAQIDTLTSGGGFTADSAVNITAKIQAGTTTCITVSSANIPTIIGDVYSSATSTSAYGISLSTRAVIIQGNIVADAAFAVNVTTGTVTHSGGNILGSTTTASTHGVYFSGAGTLISTGGGAISGGIAGSRGIFMNSAGVITVTASVTGGTDTTAYGIGANGTITITGNVVGGSGTTAYGVFASGTTATITVNGTVTGGSAAGCSGVNAANTAIATTINGNLIDTSDGSAVCAKKLVFNPGSSNYHTAYNGAGNITLYPASAMPAAKYVYNGINRGDGTTGTLHASNLHSGAGIAGSDLSAGILKDDEVVDDVTGEYTGGGGGGPTVGPFEVGAFR